MGASNIRHVSDTAYLVAECRAVESRREDALFHDPWASLLSGSKGQAIVHTFPTAAMTAWTVAIRTRIIDDLVGAAVGRGIDMVVNMGAGFDTRPYRLDLPPELTWVELDYEDVVTYKSGLLVGERPRCRLERHALDLSEVAARRALLEQLSSRARSILVLTEGVLPYLSSEQVSALAEDLRALHKLHGWVVDYVSPDAHAYRKRAGLDVHMRDTPFRFEPPDWFAFFEERGFVVHEMQYLAEVGAKLGRHAPLPRTARVMSRFFSLIAPKERRQRMRRFAGYALLKPKS